MLVARYARFWRKDPEDVLRSSTVEFLSWAEAQAALERDEDARRWRVTAAAQRGLTDDAQREFGEYLDGTAHLPPRDPEEVARLAAGLKWALGAFGTETQGG